MHHACVERARDACRSHQTLNTCSDQATRERRVGDPTSNKERPTLARIKCARMGYPPCFFEYIGPYEKEPFATLSIGLARAWGTVLRSGRPPDRSISVAFVNCFKVNTWLRGGGISNRARDICRADTHNDGLRARRWHKMPEAHLGVFCQSFRN
jgi:hypothetical protein